MEKQYSDLWYYNLMGEGEPAREFNGTARVWSEMHVRTIIVRAIQDHEVRKEECAGNKTPPESNDG